MNTVKTIWNGLLLEAPSQRKLSFLKKNLRKVQDDHGFIIKPEYLKAIKLVKTPKSYNGAFYPISQTIKLDPFKQWAKSQLETNLLIIHEYIHAVDFANNHAISQMFFEEYVKALERMYKLTKDETFNVKKRKRVNYSNPKNFLNVQPKNANSLRVGTYSNLLMNMGYGYDYCLTNPEEFAAVTMELYLETPFILNYNLRVLCEEVKNKFLA